MAEEVDDEDYCPAHPWYYKLGRPALKPDDIPASHIDGTLNWPVKDGDKRTKRLLESKATFVEALDKDIKTYKKYVKKYEAMPLGWDYPENPTYVESLNPLTGSLSLKYSHICYHKGMLERIERELAGITTFPDQQLTLSI